MNWHDCGQSTSEIIWIGWSN